MEANGNVPVVQSMTKCDSLFYELIGPFLGSRRVYKEIGYPLFCDDGAKWRVVIKNGKVALFAVTVDRGKSRSISAMYTLQEYRNSGLQTAILKDIVSSTTGMLIRVSCNSSSIGLCVLAGFDAKSRNGRFTRMELDCA